MNKKLLYTIVAVAFVGSLFTVAYAGPILTTITLAGTVDMVNNQIKNLQDPTDPQDAVTKSYVDNLFSCDVGFTDCSGTCKDTSTDEANCGACGTTCPSGQVCVSGNCQLQCAGGTTQCGSSCVNTSTDEANCGACNNACAQGQTCTSGVCGPCPTGTVECGNVCTDPSTNVNNCGACGVACAQGQACQAGTCTTGTVECGEYCTLVGQNCSGVNQLFASFNECLTFCSVYPTTGNPGDTTGDTVQCRTTFAILALTTGIPALHCPNAAPDSNPCFSP